MNSNIVIAIIVAILVLVGGAYYFRAGSVSTSTPSTAQERPLKTYYDEKYGIAFNFPDNYAVQEHDSTEGTKHHTIVVGDEAALANPQANGETPPVITIDIYNNPTKQSAEKWIKGNDFSNYKLSGNAILASTSVAGIPALAYPWDGLYQSTSIVFPNKGKMYMISVGYISPQDQIYKDFPKVVASIQLDP
jgi:hypothetical protein